MNRFSSLSFCRTQIYPQAADMQGVCLWESSLLNQQDVIGIEGNSGRMNNLDFRVF